MHCELCILHYALCIVHCGFLIGLFLGGLSGEGVCGDAHLIVTRLVGCEGYSSGELEGAVNVGVYARHDGAGCEVVAVGVTDECVGKSEGFYVFGCNLVVLEYHSFGGCVFLFLSCDEDGSGGVGEIGSVGELEGFPSSGILYVETEVEGGAEG